MSPLISVLYQFKLLVMSNTSMYQFSETPETPINLIKQNFRFRRDSSLKGLFYIGKRRFETSCVHLSSIVYFLGSG